MKNKSLITLFGLFSIVLFTCKSDDTPSETIDPELTLDQVVAKVTDNGNLKTWKIESATLTNNSVNDLEVTNAFNIKDDEFRFSLENSVLQLEHRQRHDFNKNASDYQSFLLEAYKSALNYTLINSADTPTEINATNNALKFNFQNDNLITGEWTLDANTKLNFDLTVKTAADYPTVPTSLNFEEVATIPSEYDFYAHLGSASLIASQSNQNLYIVYRSFQDEVVLRFDTTSNTIHHNTYQQPAFFTRRAMIKNNEFITLSPNYINTYSNLSIDSDPISSLNYNNNGTPPDYLFGRFDIANINNDIYIIGGNTVIDVDPIFDSIIIYNTNNQSLNEVIQLPNPKSQAAIELIDEHIYIFSGTHNFYNLETAETLSYNYNINNNSFSDFHIPVALNVSFTTSLEHLIFIGGQIHDLNENNNTTNIDAYLGVYNTIDNTFTEITHNLDDSDTSSKIHGITYINNELYVVYGNNNSANEGVTKILKASL